jgi:hypothetical protein
VSILRNRPDWIHTSAVTAGDNKLRCIESLRKSGMTTNSGLGGHLRAVHGFKYIGKEARSIGSMTPWTAGQLRHSNMP